MNKQKCNICGYPAIVNYVETDKDTGKVVVKSHEVQCLGHEGVHPAYWNRAAGGGSNGMRSLGYEDYQKDSTTSKRKNNANKKRRKNSKKRPEKV